MGYYRITLPFTFQLKQMSKTIYSTKLEQIFSITYAEIQKEFSHLLYEITRAHEIAGKELVKESIKLFVDKTNIKESVVKSKRIMRVYQKATVENQTTYFQTKSIRANPDQFRSMTYSGSTLKIPYSSDKR